MQRNHVDQSEQAHPPIRPKGNVLGESKAESQQGDRKNRQDQSRFPAGIFSVTTEIYGCQIEKEQFQCRQSLQDRHIRSKLPSECFQTVLILPYLQKKRKMAEDFVLAGEI